MKVLNGEPIYYKKGTSNNYDDWSRNWASRRRRGAEEKKNSNERQGRRNLRYNKRIVFLELRFYAAHSSSHHIYIYIPCAVPPPPPPETSNETIGKQSKERQRTTPSPSSERTLLPNQTRRPDTQRIKQHTKRL